MWITRTSINQPVFATMMMMALLVLGLFSYNRLRLERMPDIVFPAIFIQVQYPGASPEAVENDITKPVELVVNTVNGVRLIRSNSWEGRSETYLELRLDTNTERAVQDVRDKIAQIRPTFPREVRSGSPVSIRSRAACTRRCTAGDRGRCGSSRGSVRRRRPTGGSATCSTTARPG